MQHNFPIIRVYIYGTTNVQQISKHYSYDIRHNTKLWNHHLPPPLVSSLNVVKYHLLQQLMFGTSLLNILFVLGNEVLAVPNLVFPEFQ
jgi:hypothetical protein